MAICNINSGIDINDCKSMSGIVKLLIANWDDVINYTESDGIVTDVVLKPGKCFFEFIPNLNSGSLTETPIADENQVHWNKLVSFKLGRITTTTMEFVRTFNSGNFIVVIQDNNYQYWIMGLSRAAYMNNGTFNFDEGVLVEMTTNELYPSYLVSDLIISDLLIPIFPSFPLVYEITITSPVTTLTIPHLSGYVYNYRVEYGDGGTGRVTSWNDPQCSHTYVNTGTYTVTITGRCDTFYVNNGNTDGYNLAITKIISWGNV